MHEFSTMQAILETVVGAAAEHGAERVLEIRLEIGELTFLNPEQLRFALPILAEGTPAEGAALRIRRVRPRVRCSSCGREGPVEYGGPECHIPGVTPPLRCGRCGSREVEVTAGRECRVKDIRVRLPARPRGRSKGV